MLVKYLPSTEGFLGLAHDDAGEPDDAKALIVPFGLEASVSYGGGTSEGPAAILAASHEVELFDDELWCEPFREYGVATMRPFAIRKPIEAALEQIEDVAEQALAAGKFALFLGGEHSITAGSIRPYARKYPDLAILHFDAHADLRDGFEGEHYSHAAALRRCLDFEHVTLVSCGIRNISAGEIPFLEANRHRINIHWGRDRENWSIEEIVAPLKGRPVYVTFDLDGFDGSVMPSTGTPEPGGIYWNDAVKILRAASRISNWVGADVNELAPIKDFHAPDFLAAKLCYKILNYAFCGKNNSS